MAQGESGGGESTAGDKRSLPQHADRQNSAEIKRKRYQEFLAFGSAKQLIQVNTARMPASEGITRVGRHLL